MPTTIEWTDETWNPVTGCVKVSPGCRHCYAETFAERFRGTVMPNGRPHVFYAGFDPQLRPERLAQPLDWRTPRMVFVNSMSDLFGGTDPETPADGAAVDPEAAVGEEDEETTEEDIF